MSAKHIDGRWIIMICLFWLYMAGSILAPASIWFVPSEVHVDDSQGFTNPRVSYTREVRYTVEADRNVSVLRQNDRGEFYSFCWSTSHAVVKPGTALPEGEELNLDWLTKPAVCRLPPGRYRVEITWTLNIPFIPTKHVQRTSNVFTVHP